MILTDRASSTRFAKLQWLAKNPDAFQEIAKKFDVGVMAVRSVFDDRARTASQRIEMELGRMECPGFEQYSTKQRAQTRSLET